MALTVLAFGLADAARADALLEVCPRDQPCTIKHRYALKSVCELDRASVTNVLPPESKVECMPADGAATGKP